ncbi:30S ribosomal protein S8 [Candidatus Neptunichlamydia sp. REUL1]|uniref:30S ribosomal protein S8 n=1 Tax=Candidatus Neptunichlamydia sp. REUL1 TaxID=3064277 RepID=UPI002931DA18|nr:30S ribosomal protein S8 [Candidatus Neptunochlamydia sp. REUL1]
MSVTDTVADLLTRIRNSKDAKHKYVDVRCSKLNKNIIAVLQDKGYVNNFLVNEKKRQIRVFLKYIKNTRNSVIHGLKRMSKPSLRYYVGYQEIPRVFSGLGIAILSTPSGVLDGEKAREMKTGGELLCFVW